VAAELALLRPEQVRRLVLVSVPVFNAEERDAFNSRPWQSPPAEDGAHLLREWQRQLQSRAGGVTLEECTVALAERLQSGAAAAWGVNAAHNYAANERLPLLRQPALILRPRDELWDASQRARQLVRGARIIDLADQGAAVFSSAPDLLARHAREFLNIT
jgi:pimeloyl-ACP methyl ester carboxylesterase